ncbi:ABC transporter substrate-binding protein [Virgibacillus halophilus]|uniref:ABC transporter substrate-binding protein n=1 Tax=Tigheibacillus halophilus TaxID=361280 RepID=A0ABU5C8L2_9BACI|nr:ABC transporter substrate-binding protein [Virgibacillus halophilus]
MQQIATMNNPGGKSHANPKDGGSITGGMFSAPEGMFNPLFYEDVYEANIIDFVYEGLVKQDKDLSYTGQLAKSWQMNKDRTTITFHLNKHITWQDGEAFTADDVVFTYASMADPDYMKTSGVHASYVVSLLGYEAFSGGKSANFKGVTADDNHTVTFHFEKPAVNPMFIASSPIIPKHIFKDIPVKDMPDVSMERQNIIGTGPFQLDKILEGKSYVLKRFSNYWQGKPHLDKITWKVISQSSVVTQLQAGKIDILANPDSIQPADYALMTEFEHLKMMEQPDLSYQMLAFKHHYRTKTDIEKQVLNPSHWIANTNVRDTQMRQAIAYAIDRNKLVKTLLDNHGEIAHSPIPSQSWAYYGKESDPYDFHPEKSRKLLDGLGYQDRDNDGFREDMSGEEWMLHLDYPAGDPLRAQSAQEIKHMLKNVGIRVKLRETKDMSVYVDTMVNDDPSWDLFLLGWQMEQSDPDPSNFWASRSSYNFSRWHNEVSDSLLKKGRLGSRSIQTSVPKKNICQMAKLVHEGFASAPALHATPPMGASHSSARDQGTAIHHVRQPPINGGLTAEETWQMILSNQKPGE